MDGRGWDIRGQQQGLQPPLIECPCPVAWRRQLGGRTLPGEANQQCGVDKGHRGTHWALGWLQLLGHRFLGPIGTPPDRSRAGDLGCHCHSLAAAVLFCWFRDFRVQRFQNLCIFCSKFGNKYLLSLFIKNRFQKNCNIK